MCHLFHNVHIVFPPDLPTFAFNYTGLAKLSTLAENFCQNVRGQTVLAKLSVAKLSGHHHEYTDVHSDRMIHNTKPTGGMDAGHLYTCTSDT